MALVVQIDGGGKDFEVVEDMIQGAVLADIVDKGMVDNKKFKPGTKVHKCYFVWILNEEDTDGKNKRVFESFTVSMNPKSSMYKRVGQLLGKTAEELAEMGNIELDSLIGTKRLLVLTKEDSKEKGGKPFIKVTAVMPLKKGQTAPDIPADFVRKEDKTEG